MSNVLIQEKVQPYSMEAEVSVLGSMLIDNETIGLVAQVLNENSFYKTSHCQIYASIINLYDKQRVVDLVILKDELFKRSLLDKVGGIEYLMELEESVPITANVEFYAKIVREKAIKRELIAATTNIQQKAYHESLESDELLDLAEKSIFDITQQKLTHPTTKLYEILNSTFDRLETLHEMESNLTGLSTGFLDLDDITSGLQDSELIIVAARPSMGKTSFALNLAESVGVKEKKPTVIFSMEMSAQQVAQNMLCSHAKIDAHLMRTGKLDDNQWSKLPLSMGVLSEATIFIDETPGLSILELRAKARRLKAQQDIQLIILDYLQLMEGGGGESRQQDISVISRGLKAIARELKVPVIAVSQLNRSVETREGHKPRISDLRESGSIEQDADVIMLLHRDDYYDPAKNPGCVELNVAKQRNGPVGKITLTFLRQFLRFENCNTDASLDVF
ncbi:MAG: replicative DNA helicase [Planctomycetes bacterium]|nr:replicative DNA helicase [Planctomycetota bacterium]